MVNTVDIVGYGRLGQALHALFLEKGIVVRKIYSDQQDGEPFRLRDHWLQDPDMSAYVFLAIPDDQIPIALARRDSSNSLFLQCSGTCALQHLDRVKTAVWYPLQSFSLGRTVQWGEVPVLIEGEPTVAAELLHWSQGLGLKAKTMSGPERQVVHLAAVWANNFGQTVMGIAADLCRKQAIDPALLKPLIDETVQKALALSPEQAQTGPARRGDTQTQLNHLELLKDDEAVEQLYRSLSRYIQERYGKV